MRSKTKIDNSILNFRQEKKSNFGVFLGFREKKVESNRAILSKTLRPKKGKSNVINKVHVRLPTWKLNFVILVWFSAQVNLIFNSAPAALKMIPTLRVHNQMRLEKLIVIR